MSFDFGLRSGRTVLESVPFVPDAVVGYGQRMPQVSHGSAGSASAAGTCGPDRQDGRHRRRLAMVMQQETRAE
jgi:hypothetical protein